MSDPVTFTSAPAHQTISALTSRMQHVWPSDLHLCPMPTKPCQPLLQGCSMSDPMTFTSAPSPCPPNHVSPYFKDAACLTQWPSPLPPPTKLYQPLLQGCNMSDPVTFTSAPSSTHQTMSALTSRMQHVWPSDLHLCPPPPTHQTMSALTSRMQHVWPSDLHLCPLPPNHVSPYFKDAACLTQWPHISLLPPPPAPPTKPCQPIPHCCNMSDPVTMLLVFLQPCQLLSQGCNTSDPVTSLLSPPPPPRILLPSIVSALIIKVQHLTSAPPPPTMSAFITRLQGIWPSDLTCLPPPSNYVSSYHKVATHLTHWLHLCSPPHPPPHLNHVSSYYKAATHLTHWLHLCSSPPPPPMSALITRLQHIWPSDLTSVLRPPPPPPTISALITRLQHIWPSDLTSVH